MRNLQKIGLAVALAAAATAVDAGVRLSAYTTYPGLIHNQRTSVFAPLNDAGATTLNFKLPAAGKKILTYSAECAVNAPPGGENYEFLNLDVYVNGSVVSGTQGTTDAFCSSNGTSGFDGWVRSSITVVIQGKKGNNTVRILATPSFFATGLWLQDSVLVIHD